MDTRDKVRQLLNGCEEGNATTVQSILDMGIDVNICDDNYITALQVVAANGHDHIVRLLLMRGAALDQANEFGHTALLHACRNGHVHVATLLLQNQADINARTKLGANALTLAARGGHLQICKLLIESSIDQSPATGIGGSTCEFDALLAAAHHGHDTVVRYLLDRGYDVNYRTPSLGMNALMLAALNGHMTTCQVLLERGADPNLTNVNDHTPLQIATLKNTREVKGYLDRKTTNKPKLSPEETKPDIIDATKNGDLGRIVEILETDRGQVDACSVQDGATPLMFASMTGRLDIAQILVQNKCDIDKQDTVSGWTALMQATYHGKKAVAKFLINAGANVLLPAKNGCTAFDLAALIDDVDTELYRLLAAKAFQFNQTPNLPSVNNKTNSKFHKQNGVTGSGDRQAQGDGNEDHQKTGLKAWWNRMSNRFRNLKLGRTFNNNRLAPSPADPNQQTSTIPASNTSPKVGLPKKSISAEPLSSMNMNNPSKLTTELSSTVQSYDTLLLDTQKTASMYTMNMATNNMTAKVNTGTLWPVIPPFRPPPTFETDRPKMPPSNNPSRRSVSSLSSATTMSSRGQVPPMKLLANMTPGASSTLNSSAGASSIAGASPSASASFLHSNNASPSSSAGASGISSKTGSSTQQPSSASSSTLTAGSDNKSSGHYTPEPFFTPVNRVPPNFLTARPQSQYRPPMFVKPASSSSSISTTDITHLSSKSSHHARGRKGSSLDSASTLTPSPSPNRKPASTSKSERSSSSFQPKSGIAEEDELGTLFKKLSLEGYQAIFEEQEVDMEAFLTLSDQDLKELGISHTEPRRQILAAITELNSGKGRERQHLQDTMSSYHSTVPSSSRSVGEAYSMDALSQDTWDASEQPGTKSRAS